MSVEPLNGAPAASAVIPSTPPAPEAEGRDAPQGAERPTAAPEGPKAEQETPAWREVEEEDLSNLVEGLNRFLQSYDKELRFHIRRESGDVSVQVVNPETDEVIKEVPSEEIQELQSRIQTAVGMLIDQIA